MVILTFYIQTENLHWINNHFIFIYHEKSTTLFLTKLLNSHLFLISIYLGMNNTKQKDLKVIVREKEWERDVFKNDWLKCVIIVQMKRFAREAALSRAYIL